MGKETGKSGFTQADSGKTHTHQQKIPFSCLPHRKGFFHCRQIPPLVNCHQCMRTKRWVNMEKGWAYRPQPKFRWKKGYFVDGWVAWWELVVWIWHSFHGEIHGRCWWIEPRVQMIFKGSWCRRKGYLHTRPSFLWLIGGFFAAFLPQIAPPVFLCESASITSSRVWRRTVLLRSGAAIKGFDSIFCLQEEEKTTGVGVVYKKGRLEKGLRWFFLCSWIIQGRGSVLSFDETGVIYWCRLSSIRNN